MCLVGWPSLADRMSTVSLIECITPIPLQSSRTLISKQTTFDKRRNQKFTSLEHYVRPTLTPTQTPRPRVTWTPRTRATPTSCLQGKPALNVPDIRGVSLSPACSPRHGGEPETKWRYKCNTDTESMTSSDDFSEEDLDEICGSGTSHHGLNKDFLIVGSKPKIHSLYEVTPPVVIPVVKSVAEIKKQDTQNDDISSDFDREENLDLDRLCSTPENPPPSPINFSQSALDAFIVTKLQNIERTNSVLSQYNLRDFNPGVVKRPLFHCTKCEDRVLEEEQSQIVLERRQEEFARNRASPYRNCGQFLTLSSRMSLNSRMECPLCLVNTRSLTQLYGEKKRKKEQTELERKKHTTERNKSEAEIASRFKESIVLAKQQLKSKVGHSPQEVSDSQTDTSPCTQQRPLLISDLSSMEVVQEEDVRGYQPPEDVVISVSVLPKCQVRPCRSDIWPFDTVTSSEIEKIEKLRPKTTKKKLDVEGQSKLRPTPYYPLPSVSNCAIRHSRSEFSATSSYCIVTVDEIEAAESGVAGSSCADEFEIESSCESDDEEEYEDATIDNTLSSTIIIPPEDTPCSQWITFNTDFEPVLNNASANDEGRDNFLKRLQKTKLQDSDAAVPAGQNVCYQPVIDKRYNRWKRCRRKKKNSRRPTFNVDSESSDDDNEKEVERIISRMYDKIHGPAPESPGGTQDNPRNRNRRRRRENSSKSKEKDTTDSHELHYDASSEWIASDLSKHELVENSSNSVSVSESQFIDSFTSTTFSDVTLCQSENMLQPREQTSSPSRTLSADILETVPPDSNQPLLPEFWHDISGECEGPAKATELQPEETEETDNIGEKSFHYLGSSGSDDLSMYLDDYREELMQRVKDISTDDILNKDWLPDIPTPVSSRGLQDTKDSLRTRKEKPCPKLDIAIDDKCRKPQIPKVPEVSQNLYTRLKKVRRESISSDSKAIAKIRNHCEEELSTICHNDENDTDKGRKLFTPVGPEDEFRSISRVRASSWSEMGHNPRKTNYLGVVSVSGCQAGDLKLSPSPSFKSPFGQAKKDSVKNSTKTDEKGFGFQKKKGPRLPRITKTPKSQTVPFFTRRNSIVNNFDNKQKEKMQKFENWPCQRPQTIPPPQRITHPNSNNINLNPRAELMFRDYYLRSLYKYKPQHNSNLKCVKNSTAHSVPAKQLITIDSINLGNRKTVKGKHSADNSSKSVKIQLPVEESCKTLKIQLPAEDSSINLNNKFTRSFTFSMFDLPDSYKLYNRRLERRAR